MLTLQLRELEAAGLLTRTVYPVIPPHVEYSLTERGMALAPVLRGLCAWSGKYAVEKGISACSRCRPPGTERICPARRNLSRKLDFGINMGNALGLTNCEVPASRRSSCSKVYLTGWFSVPLPERPGAAHRGKYPRWPARGASCPVGSRRQLQGRQGVRGACA